MTLALLVFGVVVCFGALVFSLCSLGDIPTDVVDLTYQQHSNERNRQ